MKMTAIRLVETVENPRYSALSGPEMQSETVYGLLSVVYRKEGDNSCVVRPSI
jgi:hypothetical protein